MQLSLNILVYFIFGQKQRAWKIGTKGYYQRISFFEIYTLMIYSLFQILFHDGKRSAIW